ncbi:MAG: oxalurate catabolism protein HpxZ [Rhodovarius sp.]|nr:oxalurate catabolism protein HpxZ [Rhodovarius sp.]MCX7932368.1 oxalurate catabolism protein HpxZ [Rhodovarius sp.]MDW8315133.1 oxalurate catabolism protein HpxZ [Rhodovarius sp.]
MEVNHPEALAELTAAFYRYEKALMDNDVAVLNELFKAAPETVRYGVTAAEHLYGHDAIAAFRAARTPQPPRQLTRTVITTYGRDFGTAWTEFTRPGMTKIGRQTQAWVRFPGEGWRIVAAHVSLTLD